MLHAAGIVRDAIRWASECWPPLEFARNSFLCHLLGNGRRGMGVWAASALFGPAETELRNASNRSTSYGMQATLGLRLPSNSYRDTYLRGPEDTY